MHTFHFISTDVHLDCEKSISEFLGTQEAILYSDGLACVSSVIPAFSKAGDLIIWYILRCSVHEEYFFVFVCDQFYVYSVHAATKASTFTSKRVCCCPRAR
jgi:hypothetical protein